MQMSDAFTTGSSMMPQKKNPDMAELVRGKSGRVVGDLVSLLVMLKGLPLAYNRDLQEDKPPVFDAFDTVDACLQILAGSLASARFDARAHARGAARGLRRRDRARRLPGRQGRAVPRRAPRRRPARALRASRSGKTLAELVARRAARRARRVRRTTSTQRSIPRPRSSGATSPGGPARARVQAELRAARAARARGLAPTKSRASSARAETRAMAERSLQHRARRQASPASEHFVYRDGVLCARRRVARRDRRAHSARPATCTAARSIDSAYAAIDAALAAAPHLVAYAVKANSNLAILARLARAGAGADIVSGGELARALQAGFDPSRIVFSGVGKTDAEIARRARGRRALDPRRERAGDRRDRGGRARARQARADRAARQPRRRSRDPPVHRDRAAQREVRPRASTRARALLAAPPREPAPRARGHRLPHRLDGALARADRRSGRRSWRASRASARRPARRSRTLDAGGGWPILYGNEERAGRVARALRPRDPATRIARGGRRRARTRRWSSSRAARSWATPACCSRACST